MSDPAGPGAANATESAYAAFAARAATQIPDIGAATVPREVRSAAVIGAGTMGGGIAMNFANAGIPVWLLEQDRTRLDAGLATVERNYRRSVARGRLDEVEANRRLALIRPTLEYTELAASDIVIEAVFEDMAVKQTVFRILDRVMRPGAILASNTSTLDVNAIAAVTSRPEDVLGTHFFSPANVMKLLEVVRGTATAPEVLTGVMRLAEVIGKTAVVAGVCDGFIGNRMIEQYLRQAFFMLEEGAGPAQIDTAIEAFGFAMGPFRMSDLAGNDIGWAIRKRRYREQPDLVYPGVADKLCEQGRFGQKTGLGWYRYETGSRQALPDPAVERLLNEHRAALGLDDHRSLSDDEIVHRLLFALTNEGARLLQEGIALRASDIDLVYLTGYGFPLDRGGPMRYADRYGLDRVLERMAEFAALGHGDPVFWTPATLLAERAAAGRTLTDFPL